ncbi:hypothetical protein BV25DRAFT_1842100 [Artomyces pyxidatus]|uniref:Uncharacterized protein n=1 Tax=Artomyces pyxidatus TaxID=48021 RepID=A0ACB8SJP1_9AGAM|nr:hypothetical protein BV25DRAFT_1842100 [Artomyces pyxidatus]
MAFPPHGRVGISRVSNEVLQKIMSLTMHRDPWDLQPNADLTRFALVDRRWRAVALRELFTHVYLAFNPDDRPIQEGLEQFYLTILTRPALASMVRAIHYGTWEMEEEENIFLAKIIPLCTNLTGLKFQGWSYNTKPLLPTLASCATLRTIHLSALGLEPQEGHSEGLCTVSKFFSLLLGWKDLQRVWIDSFTINADPDGPDDNSVKALAAVPNACPSLRSFEFHSTCIRDGHLVFLSKIAPSLSELRIDRDRSRPISKKSLLAALGRWSKTLEILSIEHWSEGGAYNFPESTTYDGAEINAVLSAMPCLHTLQLPSVYVSPEHFGRGYAKVERFGCNVRPSEIPALSKVLGKSETLPSLRKASLTCSHGGFKERLDKAMWKVCQERGIEQVESIWSKTEDARREGGGKEEGDGEDDDDDDM